MEKIVFSPDGEESVEFFCLEQTIIGAKTYLLVTDEEDGDGEALILRDDSDIKDEEAVYVIVDWIFNGDLVYILFCALRLDKWRKYFG